MDTPEDGSKPKAQPAFSSNPPRPPKTTTAGMAGDSDDADRLYTSFLKERDEVNKFRETESAKVGHDIGFERALLKWIVEHREKWRNENS